MVLEPLTPADSLIVDSATCVLIAVIRELWEIMTSSSGGLSVHGTFFFLINWIKDKQQREKNVLSQNPSCISEVNTQTAAAVSGLQCLTSAVVL